ncbi:MAG TPA: hypothetical protein VKO42_05040 [Patescibacteria group bacterium]|nr:hypothetical protein [Patescibacteria group bacterium]
MENTVQEILNLVKTKMKEQGAYDRDAYKQFIEETIEFFQERGKITEDENVEFIEDRLMDMWNEVQESLATEGYSKTGKEES